jgi:PAS domain S-box-containing protein
MGSEARPHLAGLFLDSGREERADRESTLRDSVARLVLSTMNEGVWLVDAQSRTTFINQHTAAMLGYAEDEMLGIHPSHFMDEEGRQIAERLLARRRAGVAEQVEFKCIRKDGTPIWLLVGSNPLFDSEGRYAGSLGIISDLSLHKQNEARLQERIAELTIALGLQTKELTDARRALEGSSDFFSDGPDNWHLGRDILRTVVVCAVGGVLVGSIGLLAAGQVISSVIRRGPTDRKDLDVG